MQKENLITNVVPKSDAPHAGLHEKWPTDVIMSKDNLQIELER